MLFVALKRLWTRPLLTLFSIVGVTLSIGLVTAIPLFARAVSFLVLTGELEELSARSGRPPFSMRVYALPGTQYSLSMDRARLLQDHIQKAILSEIGLPLVAAQRQMESKSLVLYPLEQPSPYGQERTLLRSDLYLLVSPGVESHVDVVQGEPMAAGPPSGEELSVWLHARLAQEMGIGPGERFEISDQQSQMALPIRVAGLWRATDRDDCFWFSNPDLGLANRMLVRETDYEALVEPLFQEQLGFVSWYLILDDRSLTPGQMNIYAEGLSRAFQIIAKFIPGSQVDGSPLGALERAIARERKLTALLLVFSVPQMGFLLYFVTLISTITLRWQRRETAIMVSRGMRVGQLLAVGLLEAFFIVGTGCILGVLLGVRVAQWMGYTQSFMSFTWREPLPVSPTAFSLPMVALTVLASFVARIWPLVRSARTSVVSHERRRARAPERPFWQRFYLDLALVAPVVYAWRQLEQKGTLVPQLAADQDASGSASWLVTHTPEFARDLVQLLQGLQDPLLFLVPALFSLTWSLLLVRFFPLLMRIGDWVGGMGRGATVYLAFRQLARQSNQYTSALLLVITSLSLGAFMASMAASLDQWLSDRVQYAVGSDVYIRQLPDPSVDNVEDMSPTQGAWVLPITDYLDVPGVTHAARVGMYPVSLSLGDHRLLRGTFIGIDRLDVPEVVYYRADFGPYGLGELMNQLAPREDGILLSEKAAAQGNYEVGDKVHMRLSLWFDLMSLETDFTVVGTFKYFPTVYEDRDDEVAVIGNLGFVFEQTGAVLIHDIWLRTEPDADRKEMMEAVAKMGVFVHRWVEVREEMAKEQAKVERVGTFGTLTIGFLAAAALSGIGLLVYNYASLQERLFRFTILRAVGLTLSQVVGQIAIEYVLLMAYSVLGGAAIGVWASRLFIPFFQATDQNVLNPPMLLPLVDWEGIGRISAAFMLVLAVTQTAVIGAALRRRVFQALRMGDHE